MRKIKHGLPKTSTEHFHRKEETNPRNRTEKKVPTNRRKDCTQCGNAFSAPPTGKKLCPVCVKKKRKEWEWWKKKKNNKKKLSQLVVTYYGCCPLCGFQIPLHLHHPNPLALSFDHIIPIAQGGKNTIENLQPTHAWCNKQKETTKKNEIGIFQRTVREYFTTTVITTR